MKKQLFLIYLFLITATSMLQCMNNSTPDLSPQELISLREKLTGCNAPELDSTTISIYSLHKGERYGVCHSYALSEYLGITGEIPSTFSIKGEDDWYTKYKVLEDFERVSEPRSGDLIIYTDNNPHTCIQHTGIVHNEHDYVKSKWGSHRRIFLHKTFHVPTCYGNNVEYYRSCKSKDDIIKNMKHKIRCDRDIVAYRSSIAKTLLNLSAMSPNALLLPSFSLPHSNVEFLLETNMCAYVGISDEQKRTPLILASEAGNHKLVKILLKYGASKNSTDNMGRTALDVAIEKDHKEIINLLSADDRQRLITTITSITYKGIKL